MINNMAQAYVYDCFQDSGDECKKSNLKYEVPGRYEKWMLV